MLLFKYNQLCILQWTFTALLSFKAFKLSRIIIFIIIIIAVPMEYAKQECP